MRLSGHYAHAQIPDKMKLYRVLKVLSRVSDLCDAGFTVELMTDKHNLSREVEVFFSNVVCSDQY